MQRECANPADESKGCGESVLTLGFADVVLGVAAKRVAVGSRSLALGWTRSRRSSWPRGGRGRWSQFSANGVSLLPFDVEEAAMRRRHRSILAPQHRPPRQLHLWASLASSPLLSSLLSGFLSSLLVWQYSGGERKGWGKPPGGVKVWRGRGLCAAP